MKLKSIFVFAVFPVTVSGISDFLDSKKYNLINSKETDKPNVEYYISGSSNSFQGTINQVKEKPPDFLLIDDTFLEQENIFNFLNDISKISRRSKIIIYTGSSNYSYLNRLIKFGIGNILHKKMKREEFTEALYAILVAGGCIGRYVTDIISKGKLLSKISLDEKINPAAAGLSRREKQVFECICAGMNNLEIAEQLFISKRTVEKHCDRITNKLGLKSRRELIRLVLKNNDI